MKTPQTFFSVLRIHRDDILGRLQDNTEDVLTDSQRLAILNLSDTEIEHFASQIGNILLDGGDYWFAIDEFLDEHHNFEDAARTINT